MGVNRVLTDRLQAVADLCPQGAAIVDIGTDHAILPIALIQSECAPVAVGVDIASKPLVIATRHLEETELNGQLALVCGDGIKPLRVVDDASSPSMTSWVAPWDDLHTRSWLEACRTRQVTVTICGVGGQVAAEKIAELPSWVSVVVVQANNDPSAVDRALMNFQRSANISIDHSDVYQHDGPLWSIFTSGRATLSITLDRTRLFVTKRAERLYNPLPGDSVNEPQNDPPDRRQTDHETMLLDQENLLWLWYWVQLSRGLKVLTLTPRTHPSWSWKSAQAIDTITLWLTLRVNYSLRSSSSVP